MNYSFEFCNSIKIHPPVNEWVNRRKQQLLQYEKNLYTHHQAKAQAQNCHFLLELCSVYQTENFEF